MSEELRAEAARQFSKAADQMVDACRRLEQLGMEDPPVERLMLALEELTHHVHQMLPPEGRRQIEPADVAIPSWRVATMNATGTPNRGPDPHTT